MRAQHQILDDEVLVALEARPGRHVDLDDALLINDQLPGLALPGAALAGLVRRLRLGLRLHAARPDRPVTPLSLAISARKSATTCFSAAFSASRRSVRASRSPRDSSERGIFSGTDMPGTNRVRYEQVQPRSSSYLPGFLPQVLFARLRDCD